MNRRTTMRNIAIVEDNPLVVEQLKKYIADYSVATGQTFRVMHFSNGQDFLEQYQSQYAVVLLDIQMPQKDGMSTAMQLREYDKNISILFVTSLAQYALKGYEVDAVSFLIKPVSYFDFSLKFKKALALYTFSEERTFTLNSPGGLYRFSTDKLQYVEVTNHQLHYHLVDDCIEMSGSLSAVEQQFRPYGFLRCNNCYLVNPKFVVRVKGNTVQVGEHILQISRPRRAAFLNELANWYAAGLAEG